MQLIDFPYELVVQIASQVEDIGPFLLSNRIFYQYSLLTNFWRDLCRCHQIKYIHPDIEYKALFLSGALQTMCHHIRPDFAQKVVPWSYFHQKTCFVYCFHCEFIGSNEEYIHCHQDKVHPVSLTMSPLHVLELWCNCCKKTIGLDHYYSSNLLGAQSEKYIMHTITRTIIQPTTKQAMEARQRIEHQLLQQFRFSNDNWYMIDKHWYVSWLSFIAGKSNSVPEPLNNNHLYRPDGTLKPHLVLGEDIELISSMARWYIERVYGIKGKLLTADEIPKNDADYCRLIHKIKIRHQINNYIE